MPPAHVQVVLDGQTMPEGLEAALRRVGATASFGPISEAIRLGLKPTADAVIVVAPENASRGYHRLQALLDQLANRPRGTLVIQPAGDDSKPPPLASTFPVSFSSPTSVDELAARIETMIEMRPSLESLHRRASGGQQANAKFARQYRQQLRQASQMQRELLPHALPRFDRVSFSAVYCPSDYVSGDIYDVRRLDDDHVAVALVDAEGHGISAALLTVFIKRALRGDERHGADSRLRRPDKVLTRLNEELLEAELSEAQFAAAVYVLLNLRTCEVELARGGAPYPILRHADGRCELIRPAGPVVGVVPDASFAVESFELAPGESLILHSDGLEHAVRLLGPQPTRPSTFATTPQQHARHRPIPPSQAQGTPHATSAAATASIERGTRTTTASASLPTSAKACRLANASIGEATVPPDQLITTTRWYRRLREEGVTAALEHAKSRHDMLRRLGHHTDDLAVLAINVDR